MPLPKIRLACRHYDGTSAIARGAVQLPGFDLRVTEANNVAAMFTNMFLGKYDVSEMSLAELVYYLSRAKNDFIGIPVFPSRYFRHGFILYHTDSNIREPREVNGKRIGFLRWVQTAAIWIRGILVDEYGVVPGHTEWYVTSLHHWQSETEEQPIQPRNGAVIHRMNSAGEPHQAIYKALEDRKIDLLGITENEKFAAHGGGNIKKLFPNTKEVEEHYYRKTKIFPIMHTLVIRNEIAEKYPDLPEGLFNLFSQAKKLGRIWLRGIPSLGLAWKNDYIEMESQLFETDPWAYGIESNKHVLDRFLNYCYEEGVSAKTLTPRDLFLPSTWQLRESL